MDGFLSSAGVIVLAATNRRQDLDPYASIFELGFMVFVRQCVFFSFSALLRPGRFDVEIVVPWPDLKGRVEIFNLYLSKIKIDKDVVVESLAKSTIGFSGKNVRFE